MANLENLNDFDREFNLALTDIKPDEHPGGTQGCVVATTGGGVQPVDRSRQPHNRGCPTPCPPQPVRQQGRCSRCCAGGALPGQWGRLRAASERSSLARLTARMASAAES